MHRLIQISEDNLLTLIRRAVKEELQLIIPKGDEFKPPLNRLQASKILGISISKLDKMNKTGELKRIKMGRHVKYRIDDLKLYLENK